MEPGLRLTFFLFVFLFFFYFIFYVIHSHLADYILKNTEAHGLFCAQTSIRLSNNYVLQLKVRPVYILNIEY